MKIRKLLRLLIILETLFLYQENHAQQVDSTQHTVAYYFGVFPFLSHSRLENIFAPITSELSSSLGFEIHYTSTGDFKTFMSRLANRKYDIAFIQPFDYVRIAAEAGYIPLVARSDSLSAVIVVRQESSLGTVSDLAEKTVALPPAVAAVSYLTKLTLLEAGLNLEEEIEFKHMKGHDSALHLLLIGDVDASGVAPGPLQVFEAKMAPRFRVLAESERISSSLFVAHSRVPENTRDLIKKKLLEMPFSAAAKEWFGSGEKPFLPVIDSDYDVIRSFNKKISVKQ